MLHFCSIKSILHIYLFTFYYQKPQNFVYFESKWRDLFLPKRGGSFSNIPRTRMFVYFNDSFHFWISSSSLFLYDFPNGNLMQTKGYFIQSRVIIRLKPTTNTLSDPKAPHPAQPSQWVFVFPDAPERTAELHTEPRQASRTGAAGRRRRVLRGWRR